MATIGNADAAASSRTIGKPSHADDITNASAALNSAGISVRVPRNRTASVNPRVPA